MPGGYCSSLACSFLRFCSSVGAVTLGVDTVSSTWRDQRRETNEALLLQQTREHYIRAELYGDRTALTLEDAAAAIAGIDHGLGTWSEYLAIVEDGFIEARLPGQSADSISEALHEERDLQIRSVENSLTNEDAEALTRLDGDIVAILEQLEANVSQLIADGQASADSTFLRFLLLGTVGGVLAVAAAGLGVGLFYWKLREMLGALSIERDRTAILLEETKRLARHDQLTGLLNRMALDEEIDLELQRARRHSHELSVAMLDIDGFKKYNDTFGHVEGDRLLEQIAQSLTRAARQSDRLYRYGGDEFLLLMPQTELGDAQRAVERLQKAVSQVVYAAPGHGSSELEVSVSAGTATYPSDASDSDGLIRAADADLYARRGARRAVRSESV